jgi:protein-S-isoprenylcysteine O-methyltransferase Ste14
LKPYVDSHEIGIAWAVVAVATVLIELVGAFRTRSEAAKKDRGSLLLIRAVTIPGVLVLILSPRIVPAAEVRPPLVSVIVGIVIFAAGETLRVWSKVALGRYFTYTVQTSTDQPVIEAGPYRFVRHPSYTGIVLMAIGAGAVWGNWLGLAAISVAILIGLSYRIHVEEHALLADLGDRYRAYSQHHKRLLPYIW